MTRSCLGLLLAAAFLIQTVPSFAEVESSDSWVMRAVTPRFGLTQIYQQNVHGGLDTHEKDGRYWGSYDAEIEADLSELAGMDGIVLYTLFEGGWPDTGGIDSTAVGSTFGVNGDAIEDRWSRLSELWFERSFADGTLAVRAGKLDLTAGFRSRERDVAFDGSRYANNETSQFLNSALVNNPTIPFPNLTLGAAVFANPMSHWHLGFAVTSRESADEGDDFVWWGSTDNGLFVILQSSFLPASSARGIWADGEYRAGLWWATDDDGADDVDQHGVYVSASQPAVCVSNDSPAGLSAFMRAGWADGSAAELVRFWSLGLHCEGLFNDEGEDVLGLAVAQGSFVGDAPTDGPRGDETVWELYYNAPIADWCHLSPSVQYVADSGGGTGGGDGLILGARLQMLLE